jgi:hypothetical protein
MKPFDKFDESAFTNEVQTGWYIDRMYNFSFSAYRNPTFAVMGLYNDEKTKMTEEIGGTFSKWINPNNNLQLVADADAYYGVALPASGQPNTPYSRIRYANILLQKIDSIGQVLPESFRATSKGQMFFFRGLQYFELVRLYGGVPLVLTVQSASSTDESVRVPRSTAAEVFTQIAKDFDSAAALLPAVWSVSGYRLWKIYKRCCIGYEKPCVINCSKPLIQHRLG